jgi:hypothetical protein
MRLLIGCGTLVLVLIALASSPAAAQAARTKQRSDLATCTCRFGYGSSCVTALACGVEGGRCAGACAPQPEYELPAVSAGAPSGQQGR